MIEGEGEELQEVILGDTGVDPHAVMVEVGDADVT